MNHLNGTKIKHFQTLLAKLSLEQDRYKEEYRVLQSKMDKANNLKKHYESQLSALKNAQGTLIVSEHATLRYLERVYKLDLEKIQAEIIQPKLLQEVAEFGNGVYRSEDNYRVKVVDGVVVTILE
ncbi:hypothetical protein [Sulfurimonas sp.]